MDLIADALCILKNGSMAGLEFVDIKRGNRSIENILKILKKDNYIGKVLSREVKGQKRFRVFLNRTPEGLQFINGFKKVSKPGRRIYSRNKCLPYAPKCAGLGIVSTSKGIFPIPKAKAMGLGGEVICFVW